MVKKIRKPTNKGTTIQYLMAQGKSNAEISKILGVPRTTVSYYRKRPIELEAKRSYKLPENYINEIVKLASNKTTSQMPGGLIANKINEKLKNNNILDKKGKTLTISKRSVNRILKKKYGKPRRVKKVFYLTEEQKIKRVKFCKEILKMGIEGKNIFFTDETKIDTSPYTAGE